jgi:hypothetical protein
VPPALPWGLIGALALAAGVERGLARHRVDFTPSTTAIYEFARAAVRREAPFRPILCFGDSLMKCALLPRVIEERTGRAAYNLAVTGSTPVHHYYLLRDALRARARPRAVLVDFKGYLLEPDPLLFAREYKGLTRAGDALDLARETGRPDLALRWALGRLCLAYRYHDELRKAVADALAGRPLDGWPEVKKHLGEWKANLGAHPLPKNPVIPTLRPLPFEDKVLNPAWRCHPNNRLYIRKFFEETARRRIPVYVLDFPAIPRVQSRREALGLDRRYDEDVLSLAAGYPNVTVLDARGLGLPAEDFADAAHLDRDGSVAVSRAVAEALAQADGPRTASAAPAPPGPRTIRLAAAPAPAAAAAGPDARAGTARRTPETTRR